MSHHLAPLTSFLGTAVRHLARYLSTAVCYLVSAVRRLKTTVRYLVDPVHLAPLARYFVNAVRDDLRDVFVDNRVVAFLANAVAALLTCAFVAACLVIDGIEGSTSDTTTKTTIKICQIPDAAVKCAEFPSQHASSLSSTDQEEYRVVQDQHCTFDDEVPPEKRLPSLSDLAYQTVNISFTVKMLTQCDKMASIFMSDDECTSVARILSAVHALDARLCFRAWLVPYARLLLQRFDTDETRTFAYIVANPHLFASLRAKDEQELWCWTRACAGCNKPRHKFDQHDEEIRATYMYV